MTELTGRCLCGAVTFRLTGTPRWQAHRHCESCRRSTSSPMTSFLGVADGNWAWTGAGPKTHESSPGVRRHFCAACGSPMGYDADKFPGEMHFYAASLDRPEAFAPTFHVFYGERLAWFIPDDELPKFAGTYGSVRLDG